MVNTVGPQSETVYFARQLGWLKETLQPMSDERSGSFLGSAAIAVAIIIATIIGGWFFVKGKRGDQTITVTGSARKSIKSDRVVWKSAITYQSPVLADAYRSLSEAGAACQVVPRWQRHSGKPDHHLVYFFSDSPWT
jgi:hypothetical protein